MAFNFSPKIITDGLVLYLDAANPKSYAGTGTVWNDLSRGQNHGTLVNGPTFNSANGGSIVFDGVNDYGTISPNSQLITTEFTKSVWFNIIDIPVDSTIREVIRQGSLYFLISYRADLNPKRWEIGFWDSLGAQNYWTPSTLSLNIWQNITITGNGSNYGIYRNAILQASGTYSGVYTVGTGQIFICSQNTTARFINSRVGLVNYYNRGLTATEVLQNFNATRSRYGV
jgi:hypothetical protein